MELLRPVCVSLLNTEQLLLDKFSKVNESILAVLCVNTVIVIDVIMCSCQSSLLHESRFNKSFFNVSEISSLHNEIATEPFGVG